LDISAAVFFIGRITLLTINQQYQSTEGSSIKETPNLQHNIILIVHTHNYFNSHLPGLSPVSHQSPKICKEIFGVGVAFLQAG